MLLVLLTLCCVSFGSSAFVDEAVCYGSSYKLTSDYAPPLYTGPLYFTPRKGGSRKLLMDNGEVKDPRIKVRYRSVYLPDLTERDDGIYSISFGPTASFNIVSLKILDCSQKITKDYGSVWDYRVPSQAEFLEFTPLHSLDQPKILWNLTDLQTNKGVRGRVKQAFWKISDLTQADSGYYNFRRKDNTLEARLRVTVEEKFEQKNAKVNERLFIAYPRGRGPWSLIFTPVGGTEDRTLMRAGSLVEEDSGFYWRVQAQSNGITIVSVESTDAGNFQFRDQQGNVALNVEVNVENDYGPVLKYVIIIAVIIFGGSLCCYCFCCKKSCSKRGKSAPQTAETLDVYYHDENQPTGPSYSAAPSPSAFSHPPANSLVSEEPKNTSSEPRVYNPVNVHMSPSQPEVAPPGRWGSALAPSISSDFLSSEPTFEVKGLTFPCAPPLSSDSTVCDVYHSDKLNFL